MELIEFAEKFRKANNPVLSTDTVYTLFPFEQKFLESILANKYSLHAKSRQMHISDLLATYTAWWLIHYEGPKKNLMIVTHKYDAGVQILNRAWQILEWYNAHSGLPRQDAEAMNLRRRKMVNGNQALVVSGPDGTRGWSQVDSILVDEAAFINDFEHMYPALACMMPETMVVVSSTKAGTHFETMWNMKESSWVKFDWHYTENPMYTRQRLEAIREAITPESWASEMEMKFVTVKKKNKQKIVPIRFDDEMMAQIGERLIDLDVNLSDYIRGLVEKDLKGAR